MQTLTMISTQKVWQLLFVLTNLLTDKTLVLMENWETYDQNFFSLKSRGSNLIFKRWKFPIEI